MLEDSDGAVRAAAVDSLVKLDPEALAQHSEAIVNKLDHSEGNVRTAVAQMMGGFECL